MTVLQAAYNEVALANSRLRTENDIMRARFAKLEAEIAELRARLAAYEGQLTAEEMRERIIAAIIEQVGTFGNFERTQKLTDFDRLHHGVTVEVVNAIRALSTKREEG